MAVSFKYVAIHDYLPTLPKRPYGIATVQA